MEAAVIKRWPRFDVLPFFAFLEFFCLFCKIFY